MIPAIPRRAVLLAAFTMILQYSPGLAAAGFHQPGAAGSASARSNDAMCTQEADRDAAIRACDAVLGEPGLNQITRSEILFNRGTHYAHKGDLARAFADLSDAIRANPSWAYAWDQRATIREMQGDLAGALADATEATRLDSRYGSGLPELRRRAETERSGTSAAGAPSSFASGSASAPAPAPAASASPTTSASAQTDQNCVTVGLRPEAGNGMYATNNCSHPVIGRFCYVDDRYLSCGSSPGGFGPLAPGAFERIHGPSAASWQARWTYCNYEAWNRGCTLAEP